MRFTLKIALRYLVSKKTHSAVNIISFISVCGVVVTTAAMVCVLSVFNGFSGLIGDRLSLLDPQISVTASQGKVMADADSVAGAITAIEGVRLAVPTIEEQCLALYGEFQMPVKVKGVPRQWELVTSINRVIIDGEFLLDDGISQYAIPSVGVAIELHSLPGYYTPMRLYAPRRQGRVNLSNPAGAFRADSLFVSGVFQIDQNEYDRDMVIVPLDVARRLFDYGSEATAIEVRLRGNADEGAVMRQIEAALGPSYSVKNRLMQQATAFRMVNVEKWVTFLLLGFIMVIATFNVISTLSLLIIEKDESIAVFRSLGADDRQISRIFVAEGWLISLVGAAGGILLGLLLSWLQQHYGLIQLGGDSAVMIVQAYPVRIAATDTLVVFALVAAVGLLTSLATSAIMRRRLSRTVR